jgi:metallo-beta-lactamase family protein
MTIRLTFLGGAGTVTGSRYLVEHARGRVMVDCGLFQGLKALRLRNREPLPVPAASIDAVVLTHAHLDHSGYLPLLVKRGFRGRVHCSDATLDLCRLLLPDSGHLQEEEAEHANRYGWSKHAPALPLYTADEAVASLASFTPAPFGNWFDIGRGVRVHLSRAGHLLGAACALVAIDGRSIAFSGDVGRPHDPLMRAPEPLAPADALVVEATYGDRRHPANDVLAELGDVIRRTVARGGVVVVPAFAVGRTQALLHALDMLKRRRAIPGVLPVYLDSPMAIDATALYLRHRAEHRLSRDECETMCRGVTMVNRADDSRSLDERRFPMVVVAASGMATGGRVLHHLEAFAPDPRNTLLFTGYQAEGTRGASIVAGAPGVKVHGRIVPIRAEVVAIDGLSAHADYAEIVDWLRGSPIRPDRTFITHAEPAAALAMRGHLAAELGWDAAIPQHGDCATIG